MSELQLEVGKSYRNRIGDVVKIIDTDDSVLYPFQGSNDVWYRPDGNAAIKYDPADLIEEVDSLSESKASFERELEEYENEREADDDLSITFDAEQLYTALRAVGLGTYAYGDIHELIVLLQQTNGNPTINQLREVRGNDD